MRYIFVVFFVVFLVYFNAANARPDADHSSNRCVNMWDEGCINGQLPGSGADDDYLGGGFNPGKRSLYELFAKLQKKHHYYQ